MAPRKERHKGAVKFHLLVTRFQGIISCQQQESLPVGVKWLAVSRAELIWKHSSQPLWNHKKDKLWQNTAVAFRGEGLQCCAPCRCRNLSFSPVRWEVKDLTCGPQFVSHPGCFKHDVEVLADIWCKIILRVESFHLQSDVQLYCLLEKSTETKEDVCEIWWHNSAWPACCHVILLCNKTYESLTTSIVPSVMKLSISIMFSSPMHVPNPKVHAN